MSVREYIGARYVPIFADPIEWNVNTAYEPLTIVQHQGNSYTSRQYVPTGIDISNSSYWAETGNYNSQIEAYRQEVLQFDGRIGDLEDNFPITSNDIANGAISESKLAANSVGYNALKSESITPSKLNADTIKRFWDAKFSLTGSNMVVFGDSYTQDNIDNSVNAYWPKRVASALGCTLFNYAIAGAGFAISYQPISNQQANCANEMTQEQVNNTSIVICMAGCNDLLHDNAAADINTGINNFITWANSFFPYAQIYVIPFNFGFGGLSQARNVTITNSLNSIMVFNTARTHIVPYAWAWNIGIASRFQNQNHPNISGYNHIAAQVLNAINGYEGFCSGTGNVVNLQNATGLESGFINYNVKNGIVHMNGYVRPSAGGRHQVIIYAANHLPAILTPVNSLFVLPLCNSTKMQSAGHVQFRSDGGLTANFNEDVEVNDVCNFNASFVAEVGVSWSDYN